jgi:hypothetical protein
MHSITHLNSNHCSKPDWTPDGLTATAVNPSEIRLSLQQKQNWIKLVSPDLAISIPDQIQDSLIRDWKELIREHLAGIKEGSVVASVVVYSNSGIQQHKDKNH